MTLTSASIIWLTESELSVHHKEYRHYHHYSSDNYDSLSFLLSGVGDCDGEYLQKGGLDIWD
jgi:hypothetical protein